MAELNQNKNSKQLDRPDAVRKFILPLKNRILPFSTIKNFSHMSCRVVVLKVYENFQENCEKGSFLQCSVHIFLGHDSCF